MASNGITASFPRIKIADKNRKWNGPLAQWFKLDNSAPNRNMQFGTNAKGDDKMIKNGDCYYYTEYS